MKKSKNIKIILNCNISHYYCIFGQINEALVNIRDFLQKHYKILLTPNFWTVEYVMLLWNK